MRDLSLTSAVELIVSSDKQLLYYTEKWGKSADLTLMEIVRNNAYYDVLIALGYTKSEIAVAKEILRLKTYND